MAEELKLPVFYPGIVMEGGAVDFNGAGTVLTTESCLLNKNRNPKLSKKKIEQYLKDYYGQKHVAWLGEGIAGDDTDGHVDDLARFINPTTIVTAVEDDPRDANYKILQENLKRLKTLKDQDGRPFDVVELPDARRGRARRPAAAGHLRQLLLRERRPARADLPAQGQRPAGAGRSSRSTCPDRKVIGIDCVELIWGLGAIHCLTQQQPRV